MPKRKIIEIDRDQCDGCGLCTEACAEGALVLDEENKAVLAKEIFCDGMGACLDVCPTGALKIVERESEEYDPLVTYRHVLETRGEDAALHVHGIKASGEASELRGNSGRMTVRPEFRGCPGSMAGEIERPDHRREEGSEPEPSELSQWPIQLHLVSPYAPYFLNSELLIAADCTAFALGSFHRELLRGKKLIIACPKLDDTAGYVEKITELLKHNAVRSLTVATMVVPCCSGLVRMVERAVQASGIALDIRRVVVDIDGRILEEEPRDTRHRPPGPSSL